MTPVAFALALCIGAIGAVGIAVPSALVWIARQFIAGGALGYYVLATARIGFGLVLLGAASQSRAPRTLRVLGALAVLLGLTTLGSVSSIESGREAIEWWIAQGPGIVRGTGAPIVALGAFVAWSCAPARSEGAK